MSDKTEGQNIMRDLLAGAIPINPQKGGDYVTRAEMDHALEQMEARLDIKLENSILKIKHWIMAGLFAAAVMFSGGFITTIIKIDRMAEKLPAISETLEARRVWSEEKNEHDSRQDRVLEQLDKTYQPLPIRMPSRS